MAENDILEWQESEPDRDLVFRDREGDYWWYDSSENSWAWGLNEEYIGRYGYGLTNIHGPHKAVAHHPMVCVGYVVDGRYHEGPKPEAVALERTWLQDSGTRTKYAGGGVRDSAEGKPRFDLLWPVGVPYEDQFLTQVAQVLEQGAKKHAERNWEAFHTADALEHAKASLGRHYANYMAGSKDEPHLALMACNLLFLATIQWKIDSGWVPATEEGEVNGN